MAAPRIEISGLARPLKAGSLRIVKRVHARSTAKFEIVDHEARWRFEYRQPVEIFDLDGVRKKFGGWIETIEERSWYTENGESDGIVHTINCIDHTYLLDKRVCREDFEDMLAGDVIRAVITNYVAAEGVKEGTIEDGDTLERINGDHISCFEVIEEVVDTMRWVFRVDADRFLHAHARSGSGAAVAAYGTGMLRNTVKVRRRNFGYRNKQYVLGSLNAETGDTPGGIAITTFTEEFEGDGSTRQFPLAFGIQNGSSVTVETNRGGAGWVTETFGLGWDPSTEPSGQWFAYGFYPYLNQDAAETVLAAGDFVRITYEAYPVHVSEHVGDGSTSEFDIGVTTDSLAIWVDYLDDGSFVAEEALQAQASPPKSAPGGEKWYWMPGWSGVVRHQDAAVLTANDRVRLIAVDNRISDGVVEDSAEIARLKEVEGNTTTGIVESVMNDSGSRSEAERIQKAQSQLNRRGEGTIEVGYQTYRRQLAEPDSGTNATYLPEHGFEGDVFLIDEVLITDRRTDGEEDENDSPLLYQVSTISGVTTGVAGGEIGRGSNPRRATDLFRHLKDRHRPNALRPPEAVKPPATAIVLPDALASAKVWVEGDDHTLTPTELVNRIMGEGNLPSWGTNNPVIPAALAGHTVLHFDNWDTGSGHDGYRKADYAAGEIGDQFTVIIVQRIDHWSTFPGNAAIVISDIGWRAALGATAGNWRSEGEAGSVLTVAGGPVVGTWAIHTLIVDGADSKYRIQAVEEAIGTLTSSTPGANDSLHIGNYDGAGADVAAFALYLANLEATGELAGQEAYFADRFGL